MRMGMRVRTRTRTYLWTSTTTTTIVVPSVEVLTEFCQAFLSCIGYKVFKPLGRDSNL